MIKVYTSNHNKMIQDEDEDEDEDMVYGMYD